MRISRAIVIVGCGALAACGAPAMTGDTTLAEAVLDMSDALVAVRDETALLQAQVDSLREQMARQDTLVRRLAAMAGLQPR
jgi:hypothetical protein